jgi:CBS domain-containing protein
LTEKKKAAMTEINSEVPLAHVRVCDAMHTGVLTTDPGTPLRVVARLMAERKVHAIAVSDDGFTRRPWGVVSTIDIAAAVASGEDLTAGQAAKTEVVTVRSDDYLEVAAQLMAEHRLSHLFVIDPRSGHLEGILSALDVAAAYGG